jgi:uncharacterized membrane protein YgcG
VRCIEVGYGLEAILPDGLAGQIIRETFTPAFRDDDYGRGIIDGTTRVAGIVTRNQPLTAEQRAALDRAEAANDEIPIDWFLVPFFALFVVIGFGFGGGGVGARAIGPILRTCLAGIDAASPCSWHRAPGLWILVALAAGIRRGSLHGQPEHRARLQGLWRIIKRGWVWGEGSGGNGGSSVGQLGCVVGQSAAAAREVGEWKMVMATGRESRRTRGGSWLPRDRRPGDQPPLLLPSTRNALS